MNKTTNKWFLVGFGLTLALLLSIVAAWPLATSSAQEGTNPNGAGGTYDQASNSPRTDDPLGRTGISIAQDVPPGPNNRVVGGDLASTAQQTDDLLGRVGSVPPASSTPGANDRPASAEPAGPGNIVPPETEGQRQVDVPGSPLVIPGADFRSDGLYPDGIYFSFWSGYLTGYGSGRCAMAPAYLPQGATVYDVYATVVDNEAADSIWVDLLRVDNYDGSVDTMAEMATTSAYAAPDMISLEDYPIDYPVVEYPTYSYYVVTCLHTANLRLYSVRLWYY